MTHTWGVEVGKVELYVTAFILLIYIYIFCIYFGWRDSLVVSMLD